MKSAAIAVGTGLALAMLVRPEVLRYVSERRLGAADSAFELTLGRFTEIENASDVLHRISDRATAAARWLPGDSRGWVLAGSCQLVAGNADRALGFYRQALAIGERAEIDLNLGRAEAVLRRDDNARAAFVRSVWISPALVPAIPPAFADPVNARIARLEAELRAGRLAALPPIPR